MPGLLLREVVAKEGITFGGFPVPVEFVLSPLLPPKSAMSRNRGITDHNQHPNLRLPPPKFKLSLYQHSRSKRD